MIRAIVVPKSFESKLEKYFKKYPHLKSKFAVILPLLAKNPKNSLLKTHKLSGNLRNLFACSVDYSHRLVFYFDDKNIYLLNIGTHDEVY